MLRSYRVSSNHGIIKDEFIDKIIVYRMGCVNQQVKYPNIPSNRWLEAIVDGVTSIILTS